MHSVHPKWSIINRLPHPSRICLAAIRRFVVNRRCRPQPPHTVCRPLQKATNTYGNWSNSIRWTLNLRCGKWSICSYHRRSCTETLAIGNVSAITRLASTAVANRSCYFTETKSQFARDDPAFLVLLILCIFGESKTGINVITYQCIVYSTELFALFSEFSVTSIGFTWTLNLTFGQTFYCILYIVVVDFILAGLIVSTLTWLFTNRYLRERVTDADIEWGYCFDVHLNAFFPPLVILHFIQLLFFNSEFSFAQSIIRFTSGQYVMPLC